MNFLTHQAAIQADFYVPKIENVVGTFTLDIRQNFRLAQIASRWNNSRYNRVKFSGLIARNQKPKATFMVFSNGKVIVTGVKSQNQCLLSSSKLIKKMSKFGALKSLKPKQRLKINNVVASINTRMKINLQVMNNKNPINCKFTPQTFPGLIYRMHDPKITFLIFSNGKVIITGGKSETEAATAFRKLYKILKQHRVLSQNILELN